MAEAVVDADLGQPVEHGGQAGGEQVARHHPLHGGHRGVQVAGDGVEADVDDRGVEQGRDRPTIRIAVSLISVGSSLSGAFAGA
jgi:hypothetical protein